MDSAGRYSGVFWIGGGSCAGKSTLARMLELNHGFTVYDADPTATMRFLMEGKMDHDEVLRESRERIAAEGGMKWLLSQSAAANADMFLRASRESLPLIAQELAGKEYKRPIVVDSLHGHPSAIRAAAPGSEAIYVFAERKTQERCWRQKPWPKPIIYREMASPDSVFAQWLRLHRLIDEAVKEDCDREGVEYHYTAGVIGLQESYELVATRFSLRPKRPAAVPEGPFA